MIIDSTWTNLETAIKAAVACGRLGPGRNFFVSNGTAQHGARAGADAGANRGTPMDPFATADYAVGLCTAGRQDNVILMQGHAENITAAGGLDLDVAGVTLFGMGTGTLRPTFTFTTATTADVDVDAANVTVDNVVFTAGVDELAAAIDVNAAGFAMRNSQFNQTASSIQTIIALTCDSSNLLIEDCYFADSTGVAAATASKPIVITGTPDNVIIRGTKGNRMRMVRNASATLGLISFTGAATNVQLENLFLWNTLSTSSACIDLGSAAVAGLFDNILCRVEDNASVAPIGNMGSAILTLNNVFVINNDNERGLVVGTASA